MSIERTNTVPAAHLTEATPSLARFSRHLRGEARKDGAYLVPLRIFIGLGWLRAFAEKAIDPDWRNGTYLSTYLNDRLREGSIALPPYESLVTGLFLPNASALGWIVTIGQVLAGLAILTGCLTRAALIGGLFMNLNFLLAGEPDPNAFYVVIQTALLLANAGAILGLDEHLPELVRPCRRYTARRLVCLGTGALLSLLIAGYALVCANDWSPAGSVHDPAMILAILALMTASWSAITLLRIDHTRRDVERAPSRSEPGVPAVLAVRRTTSPT
jgi:thiosulfate dehydrogenase (quinone) large subunit